MCWISKKKKFSTLLQVEKEIQLYMLVQKLEETEYGATMASAEFNENSESKRPQVQVGDPFIEKLL